MMKPLVLLVALASASFGAPTVNVVSDFGATINDDWNDETAIQNAIDFLHNQGGGTVKFPYGSYQCNTSIFVRENVRLLGELGPNGARPEIRIKDWSESLNLEKFGFIHMYSNSVLEKLFINGNKDKVFSYLPEKWPRRGIFQDSKMVRIRILNSTISNFKVCGIFLKGPAYTIIDSNTVTGNVEDAIYASGDYLVIANNQISGNGDYGIAVEAESITPVPHKNITITENTIQGGTDGIGISNKWPDCNTHGASGVRITKNNISLTQRYGVYVGADGPSNLFKVYQVNDVLIDGNVISNCGQTSNAASSGIGIDQSYNIIISRNTISSNSSAYSKYLIFSHKSEEIGILGNSIVGAKNHNLFFRDSKKISIHSNSILNAESNQMWFTNCEKVVVSSNTTSGSPRTLYIENQSPIPFPTTEFCFTGNGFSDAVKIQSGSLWPSSFKPSSPANLGVDNYLH